MATKYASFKGVKWMEESLGVGKGGAALVTFTIPAFTDTTDTLQLGGGGYDAGVATTDSLVTVLQKRRRDGKTVTLDWAMGLNPGLQGSTEFYLQAGTVSGSNVTFAHLYDAGVSGNAQSAASGVTDRAVSILVGFSAA